MDMSLLKSDTVKTAIAGICIAAGAYFSGEMEIATALQTGVGCLIAIFLRRGVEKGK